MPWAVITAVGDCLMGRIRDAIGVLRNGLPEPGVREVKVVEVEGPKVYVPARGDLTDVYVAQSRRYRARADRFCGPPEWHGKAFLTCTQAFAEGGDDAELTKEKALIHDGKAYIVTVLVQRELAGKWLGVVP